MTSLYRHDIFFRGGGEGGGRGGCGGVILQENEKNIWSLETGASLPYLEMSMYALWSKVINSLALVQQ